MSERWKYQIKHGLFYGITITILMALFDLRSKTLHEIFVNPNFLLKVFVMAMVGIFLIGSYSWRQKQKQVQK